MAKRKGLTAAQFARGYAERSGVTVEWLRQNGQEAMPCDCGDDICEGWQMAHLEPPLDWKGVQSLYRRIWNGRA